MGRKKGEKAYSEAVKKQILNRINKGETIQNIAYETGISRQTIIKWKQNKEKELEEPQSKVVPKGDYGYSEDFKKKVVKEATTGTPIPDVAKTYDIPEEPIRRWVRNITIGKKTKVSNSIEVAIRNLSDEISKVDLILSDEKSILFKIWRQK